MKIATWNVNSIRARIDNLKRYLKINSPDIILLQEIKAEEKNYPLKDLKELGYFSYINGQKSYNGVAILTKKKIDIKSKNLKDDKVKQARYISASVKFKKYDIEVINIYVPNGNPVDTEKYQYKILWLNNLIKEVEKKIKKKIPLIIGGDFNIIPDEKDVYSPNAYSNDALFRLEIRKKFRTLINLGLYDAFRHFNKGDGNYTFWDYQRGSWQKNNGLRIDHFLMTSDLINNVKKIEIKKNIRNQLKPSDHVPVECIL